MTLKQQRLCRRLISGAIVIVICLITLLPIWMVVTLSLKTNAELMKGNVMGLPAEPVWANYGNAWKSGNFSTYFFNSVYISAISVVCILAFALLGAYAMVYFKFPGSKLVLTLVLTGLLIPTELTLIPQFTNMRLVGLNNTREAVILLHIAGNCPFGIFLLRGFMRGVPKSLIEAARIDGATERDTLFRIVTPMVKPALIALLVMTFMWTWNNYFLSRVFLLGDGVRTLPLGLDNFRTKFSRDNVMTAAAAVIVALPVLVIYLIFQQKMVQGMVIGAVKE